MIPILSRINPMRRVFEKGILRRIFGPKRDENGELHSLYRSPNIVRVIKSRRLRWAGHVARMEEGRSTFKYHGTTVENKGKLILKVGVLSKF